jgi:phospholipid transport system substrate-binding protein
LLGALGLGWILTASGVAAEAVGPKEVVRQTIDEVVAILQDPALDDRERRKRIEALAYERFHFDTVSRLVLGRDWRRFSEPQRQEFMQEFRTLLSRSYGERINRYEQEKVEILKVHDEPRGDVTVVTRIQGGTADGVEIAYRMRKRDESWGVIDVTVEGTGLVSNYRSQFKELLGSGSPDDLLQRLREKNQEIADPAPATTTAAGS